MIKLLHKQGLCWLFKIVIKAQSGCARPVLKYVYTDSHVLPSKMIKAVGTFLGCGGGGDCAAEQSFYLTYISKVYNYVHK